MASFVGRVLGGKKKDETRTETKGVNPFRRSRTSDAASQPAPFRRTKTSDGDKPRSKGGALRRTKTTEDPKKDVKRSLKHIPPSDMIKMLEMQAQYGNNDAAAKWFETVKNTSTSGYFQDESSGQFMTKSEKEAK